MFATLFGLQASAGACSSETPAASHTIGPGAGSISGRYVSPPVAPHSSLVASQHGIPAQVLQGVLTEEVAPLMRDALTLLTYIEVRAALPCSTVLAMPCALA
jgi:hypothetical protein